MFKKSYGSPGQALLVIVLIVTVILTIGLAVISRSITNIKISTEQEESARVFSVAEAGIEEALRLKAVPPGGVTIGEITAVVEEVTEPNLIGGGQQFVFPKKIAADSPQTVWLVGHSDATGEPDSGEGKYSENQIEVCWGNRGLSGEAPALVATLYYQVAGSFRTKKYAIDSRARGGFETPDSEGSCTLSGQSFQYGKILALPGLGASDAYFALRLRLYYNTDEAHYLGVSSVGGSNLPLQAMCFESTATMTTTGLTREVRHCQPYKVPPQIFDYVLYSNDYLQKVIP